VLTDIRSLYCARLNPCRTASTFLQI